MPGDLQRGVEDAVHELLEVDRASELAEQAVSPALQLRTLECAGELSGQLVHLAPHLVDRADELLVRRSACRPPTTHDDADEHSRGRDGRGNDHDRHRHVVS